MLDYLEKTLSKQERRKVARYMSQYNNMDSIIQSRYVALFPSKTSSIKEDAVQESNNNTSDAESYLDKKTYVDELVTAKKQMDIAYKNAKPFHKLIWDEHFIKGYPDVEVFSDPNNDLGKTTYYSEKKELMLIVAECLGIG